MNRFTARKAVDGRGSRTARRIAASAACLPREAYAWSYARILPGVHFASVAGRSLKPRISTRATMVMIDRMNQRVSWRAA